MSQIEQTLRAIIDGTEYTDAPQSRIEAILYAMANDLEEIPPPYTGTPLSRIEELLVQIKENGGGGEPVPVPVTNPALHLMDWEGTVLKEYTAEQVASLTELPEPSSLSTKIDRELLTFQGWNWALTDIKSWVTVHEGECLTVGAIYTTTDGEDHTYWDNPIFGTDMRFAVTQKRGTTDIGYSRYQNCGMLERISLPTGATNVSPYAFNNCTSLASISLPSTVQTISGQAFYNCPFMRSVSLPHSIQSIAAGAFRGCASLKSITIPDAVTSIGSSAFQSCSNLREVNLSDSHITSLGLSTFQDCLLLKNISLPDTITSIGDYTFQSCTSLSSIILSDTITNIGSNAFNYDRSLNAIVVKGKPELSNINAFANIYSGCLFYVPRENLSWFETATNWATFYAQDKIVAIEDNIDFLRAIGIDV